MPVSPTDIGFSSGFPSRRRPFVVTQYRTPPTENGMSPRSSNPASSNHWAVARTTSRQFPTSTTLPSGRRIALSETCLLGLIVSLSSGSHRSLTSVKVGLSTAWPSEGATVSGLRPPRASPDRTAATWPLRFHCRLQTNLPQRGLPKPYQLQCTSPRGFMLHRCVQNALLSEDVENLPATPIRHRAVRNLDRALQVLAYYVARELPVMRLRVTQPLGFEQ